MAPIEILQQQFIRLQQKVIMLQQHLSYLQSQSNNYQYIGLIGSTQRKLDTALHQLELTEDRINSKFNEDYMYNKWRKL